MRVMSIVDSIVFMLFMFAIDTLLCSALLFVGIPSLLAFAISYIVLFYFYDEVKAVYTSIKLLFTSFVKHAPV